MSGILHNIKNTVTGHRDEPAQDSSKASNIYSQGTTGDYITGNGPNESKTANKRDSGICTIFLSMALPHVMYVQS